MRLRGTFVVAALAAMMISGCGGGDDGESGSAASQEAPVSTLTKKDETELVAVTEKLKAVVAARNGKAFCAAIQPDQLEESVGSLAKCIKRTKKLFGGEYFDSMQIEDITGTREQATVTYKSGEPRELTFVKQGGQWYIGTDTSEEQSGQKK